MDINPADVKKRIALRKFGLAIGLVLLLIICLLAVLFAFKGVSLEVILLGGQRIELEYGTEFIDPGVQVRVSGANFFQSGLEVTSEISAKGSVDTTKVGTYTLDYTARFFWWERKASRTVTVVDRTAPTITLTSVPGYYTIPGEVYQEEGFSAWDAYDGDLSDQVQRVEQDGFVTYTVSDSSGNRTQVRRKIRYDDPVPPVITLAEGETIHIDAATKYTEPGFSATDNCDGDITGDVQVEGAVDPYIAGTYELTYTVRDSCGNTATAVRNVVVVPREIPETVTPLEKTIYLTFDDGPSPYTEQLLEILDKYDVKATFFVVNSDYIDLIEKIVSEGHAIGIHSVTHDYKQIYASTEAFFDDLLQMQEIIQEKAGVTTTLMRFPGGSSNTVSRFTEGIMTRLTQAVEDAGFQYFDWNVDSNDAGGAKTAERVFKNVTSGIKDREVSVVLQHDTKGFSVEAVEKIIRWGLENGYTFRSLDTTSPTAHHGVNN